MATVCPLPASLIFTSLPPEQLANTVPQSHCHLPQSAECESHAPGIRQFSGKPHPNLSWLTGLLKKPNAPRL